MKKIFNLTVIFAAMMTAFVFSSCQKDDTANEIDITFAGGTTSFTKGTPIVAIIVTAEKITAISLYKDDARQNVVQYSDPTTDKDGKYLYTVTIDNGSLAAGSYYIQVTSKTGDNKGRFTVTDGTNPNPGGDELSAPAAFTWQRVYSAAGTGLSTFGLSYTSNSNSGHATIKPVTGAKLVILTADAWTSLDKSKLESNIEQSSPATEYVGVSTTKNGTYNDVLGVKTADGTYYLINVTKGTIATSNSGTTVTIEGQYKK